VSEGTRTGRLGRWFQDPGHTAAVVLVTLLVGLIGGGTVVSVTGGSSQERRPAKTVTVMQTTTVTEPSPAVPAPEEEALSVGLEELNEEEDVEFDVASEFGTRNIGGQTYNDALTSEVYADGAGVSELTIFAQGRFSSMHFVVGVDAETECPKAKASVALEDQSGNVLWEPREVDITHPIEETVQIPNPLQIVLVQRSMETESSCNGGMAQVSWGAVTFQGAS
jgi:hypothetical protein